MAILRVRDNDGNVTDITALKGDTGADGFSPTVTVKTDTDDTYILTVTDVNGSYDTPNLKGGLIGQAGGGAVNTVNGIAPDENGDVFLYGEQTETISVVDETVTVVQVGNDIGAFIQEMDHSVFVENATFDVSINGVDYMGICSFQAPSTNADGSPPMLIMDTSNQVVAMVGFMEGMGNGIFFSGMSVTVGESMPLRITKTVETVQTIPVKYLDIDGIKNAVFASVINAAEEAL